MDVHGQLTPAAARIARDHTRASRSTASPLRSAMKVTIAAVARTSVMSTKASVLKTARINLGSRGFRLFESWYLRRVDFRKTYYILPNLFTLSSVFCGFISISLSASGEGGRDLYQAALAICFGFFFDTADGRVARLTKTQTDLGRDLDSLADLVTFGVAPGDAGVQVGPHRLRPHRHLRGRAVRVRGRDAARALQRAVAPRGGGRPQEAGQVHARPQHPRRRQRARADGHRRAQRRAVPSHRRGLRRRHRARAVLPHGLAHPLPLVQGPVVQPQDRGRVLCSPPGARSRSS